MLKDLRCGAQLPAGDIGRARRWYSESLALEPTVTDNSALHYACRDGTFFTIFFRKLPGLDSTP